MPSRNKLSGVAIHFALIAFAAFYLVPLLVVVLNSLRSSEDIMWTVQFRSKDIKPKRFKFPIRRGVAEGKAQPFGHYPTGDDDLKSPTLMCEPAGLNTAKGRVILDHIPKI